ncbi:DUF2922 domain-containing protein [Peptoniphilus equinus]|uniref:DUF2922 domain-containing protein n=1 Tax=Peptoniphilus equinus TaxID=3016343 RepID=A0ABY7QTG1_9FIRM|nr:DUF2922 domain-containing protein [Peptoniphilus equinus]WBW49751.1 DUF2922 domain-containing protein [Peptoniphilus equinus]
MATTNTLEVIFLDEAGDTKRFSFNDPKSDITAEHVQAFGQSVITTELFQSPEGDAMTQVKRAYVRSVTERDLIEDVTA